MIIRTHQFKHFLLGLKSKRIAKSNFHQKWSLVKLFPKNIIVFTFLKKMGALILQHFPSWYISTKKGRGVKGAVVHLQRTNTSLFGGGGRHCPILFGSKSFLLWEYITPYPLPHEPNYDVINGYLVTSLDVVEEGEKTPGYLMGMSE